MKQTIMLGKPIGSPSHGRAKNLLEAQTLPDGTQKLFDLDDITSTSDLVDNRTLTHHHIPFTDGKQLYLRHIREFTNSKENTSEIDMADGKNYVYSIDADNIPAFQENFKKGGKIEGMKKMTLDGKPAVVFLTEHSAGSPMLLHYSGDEATISRLIDAYNSALSTETIRKPVAKAVSGIDTQPANIFRRLFQSYRRKL